MTLPAADRNQWDTWREIHAQPDIWQSWLAGYDFDGARTWVSDLAPDEVWFCGAGTSAYIGDILAAGFEGRMGPSYRSVHSTDLVSRPATYLDPNRKVLVVNFGRSGNSAESIGTLDALAALTPNWAQLNITCNGEGSLARSNAGMNIILPDACHDQGFAMTSSFSTMLLTALAVFDSRVSPSDLGETLADQARALLPRIINSVQSLPMPERAVYVGAGPLMHASREMALKVMELTAGQIPSIWDSTLGFRHGPKSFVTANTAIHVLISADGHAAAYDHDLLKELRSQFPNAQVISIGPGGDIDFHWGNDASAAVLAALSAQIQGVLWAEEKNLNVDNPFVGLGTLTRVVADVPLHKVAV